MPGETFAAGSEPVPVCWLCAHMITAHDRTLADFDPLTERCSCARDHVYPGRRFVEPVPKDPEKHRTQLDKACSRWATMRANLEAKAKEIPPTRASERQAQAKQAAARGGAATAARRAAGR